MDNKFWRIEYKLPKGFRWKDGEKHKVVYGKHGHHKDQCAIILLEVNDDLYIQGMMCNRGKDVKPIWVINNWRNVPVHDVLTVLNGSWILCNILLKYYREHGIYCGLMVPVLRDISPSTK